MKNKITKLSFAVLMITGITYGQSQPMSDKVSQATNVEFLQQYAKEKTAEFEKNYNKAVEIARAQGMPLSGEEDGSAFSLIGYEEESGSLKYYTTFNNVASGSSLQTANAKSLHSAGIDGTGVKVGVWDGGVGLATHQAFTGGRYVIRDDGNASWTEAIGRLHAAHVAGTVAAGDFGDGTAKGFAYGAQVYAYNWANDLAEMAAAAANPANPILVSNHSYGIKYDTYTGGPGIFGRYDTQARSYDIVANNAPYYTIVKAAGNDRTKNYNPGRGGKDLLTWAGVSKNTVVVAAVEGVQNYTGPASVVMTGFSNWGPTDDYRIKPDIAAKGWRVKSIGNSTTTATTTMDGTSMAAPAVSGVFVLWQGYHQELFERYMLSSTIRALMAHTAREAGPGPGPDFMFGWGLIDAGRGVEIMDQADAGTALIKEFTLLQETLFEYEFEYDGVEPLVVTMAWNDPAFQATQWTNVDGKTLVNDLDMRLINTDTEKTYYPWALRRTISIPHTSTQIATNEGDNMRDNIEKIEPENAVAGNYKIVITHKDNLTGGDQDYSLIISGAGGTMPHTDGTVTVSVEKYALESLNVYPNPTTDILYIAGDLAVLEGGEITIYNINGKKVSAEVFSLKASGINVSNLEKGVYILTISKNGAKQDYKFIKK